mmetsp:Transcript_26400/g.53321  ORF Transcript_26400/g.53321 Transcript_26400/m.53321 type:complete len:81 (-) Transcript_26400:1240-1482(-)
MTNIYRISTKTYLILHFHFALNINFNSASAELIESTTSIALIFAKMLLILSIESFLHSLSLATLNLLVSTVKIASSFSKL